MPRLINNYDPFYYQNTINNNKVLVEDINGKADPNLEYQCKPTELEVVDILSNQDMLLKSILNSGKMAAEENEVFFYHGDHLGSANWITDMHGSPIQYIHYAPYGELIVNQTPHKNYYNERYKFTGKERDTESGYDFFGARYLSSILSHWLSVDPLSDKYPSISPYAYCSWNPINFADPDGRDVYRYDDKTGDFKLYQKTDDNFDQIGKFKYDRKTKEYKPRLNKDGSIKTYSDYLENNEKIAKGILRDDLNIKQNGARFFSDNTQGPSLSDFYNFALILDEVAGVEISGYVLENSLLQKGKRMVQFEPYENNSYNTSSNRLYNSFGLDKPIIHFHTHGHASGYNEAITPSDNLDIPFKNKIIPLYPDIQLLILHNYGTPIKY